MRRHFWQLRRGLPAFVAVMAALAGTGGLHAETDASEAPAPLSVPYAAPETGISYLTTVQVLSLGDIEIAEAAPQLADRREQVACTLLGVEERMEHVGCLAREAERINHSRTYMTLFPVETEIPQADGSVQLRVNRFDREAAAGLWPLEPGKSLRLRVEGRTGPAPDEGGADALIPDQITAEDWIFYVEGEEILDTPMGKLETIYITQRVETVGRGEDGRFDIWYSPALRLSVRQLNEALLARVPGADLKARMRVEVIDVREPAGKDPGARPPEDGSAGAEGAPAAQEAPTGP